MYLDPKWLMSDADKAKLKVGDIEIIIRKNRR